MLYLDHKQELELDRIKAEQHWHYEAIMALARVIKENEKGYFDFEEFYNEVKNK